jgi:hypothetical protein
MREDGKGVNQVKPGIADRQALWQIVGLPEIIAEARLVAKLDGTTPGVDSDEMRWVGEIVHRSRRISRP